MRVLFIAQYGPLAASSRTRVFQYLPHLERAGIETQVRVVIPDSWSTRIGHRGAASRLLYYVASFVRTVWVGIGCVLAAASFDRVVIQKVLFPGPISLLLRRWRSKIIYDFDDAIFTTDAPRGLLGRLSAWRRGSGLPRMLSGSSTAIVENEYTRAYAAGFCERVEIITGPIDTDRYAPGAEKTRSDVVLGWIGSPTTTPYLDEIVRPLEEVVAKRDNVSLRLIGALPFEPTGIRVEQFDWSLETEVELLAGCDIGLMPLPDDPWTRGKGGYKLLQYCSVGLPVIASPVGVNTEIVEDGLNGFLADSDETWIDTLIQLIDDSELRSKMGRAGRKRMLDQFSLDHSSRKFVGILNQSNK
jgi:glycosyltransferase involved in cell wall biosynthesis